MLQQDLQNMLSNESELQNSKLENDKVQGEKTEENKKNNCKHANSNNLFVGCASGELIQWSISENSINSNLENNFEGGIATLTIDPKKENVYITDSEGYLARISISRQKIDKRFPRVHQKKIRCMIIS